MPEEKPQEPPKEEKPKEATEGSPERPKGVPGEAEGRERREKPKEEKPQEPPKEATEGSPEQERREKPHEPPKEEKPKEEKPKEEVAPAAKKRKKINRMTLKEIDKKLEEIKEKMGSFTSKYAIELLRRKKELTGQ